MSTVSVPLTPKLEEAVGQLVKLGRGANKADVIRQAIANLAEDEAVMAVLRSEQEIKEGKLIKGDLKKVLKKTDV